MAHSEKCMRRGCKNHANGYRGLCLKCYRVAYSLIHSRKTTWAKLERKGMAKPDARRSKSRDEFIALLK